MVPIAYRKKNHKGANPIILESQKEKLSFQWRKGYGSSLKDLAKIRKGQRVNAKIASLAGKVFTGRITLIGSNVEGETRVVPVKAELDNTNGLLKPGMFAELEVLMDQSSTNTLAIPTSAVVEANDKQLVYYTKW